MSDREHPHLVLRNDESVQRDIPRLAVGDHELPNIAVHAPPEQRVRSLEAIDGALAPGFSLARNSKARSRWDSARAE